MSSKDRTTGTISFGTFFVGVSCCYKVWKLLVLVWKKFSVLGMFMNVTEKL